MAWSDAVWCHGLHVWCGVGLVCALCCVILHFFVPRWAALL